MVHYDDCYYVFYTNCVCVGCWYAMLSHLILGHRTNIRLTNPIDNSTECNSLFSHKKFGTPHSYLIQFNTFVRGERVFVRVLVHINLSPVANPERLKKHVSARVHVICDYVTIEFTHLNWIDNWNPMPSAFIYHRRMQECVRIYPRYHRANLTYRGGAIE